MDLLYERVTRLVDYPKLGPAVPWLLEGLRVLTVQNYLIFYSVADSPKSVTIECVLHGSRDLKALFEEEDGRNDRG
jgi:plasmid stabilization system protein ParE